MFGVSLQSCQHMPTRMCTLAKQKKNMKTTAETSSNIKSHQTVRVSNTWQPALNAEPCRDSGESKRALVRLEAPNRRSLLWVTSSKYLPSRTGLGLSVRTNLKHINTQSSPNPITKSHQSSPTTQNCHSPRYRPRLRP